MTELFENIESAGILAQAIVDTVREPLLVLNARSEIVAASRSFHTAFKTTSQDVIGQPIYFIFDGQLNLPTLHDLLDKIAPDNIVIENFEFTLHLPEIGRRLLILNARKIILPDPENRPLLLAFQDITAQRAAEAAKATLLKRTEDLLRQKDMLLLEMQHRIANSLQIIASILMMKARSVTSPETRAHLQDAHRRVISVATVQQHLQFAGKDDRIEIRHYLTKLCASLSDSMIGEDAAITLDVIADPGAALSADAVSLGLIVMELVINALKYAFPAPRTDARVTVRYEVSGADWQLIVADNGVGKQPDSPTAPTKAGLGTSLVKALAQQLGAQIDIISRSTGLTTSITHTTFTSRLPDAP